MEITHISDEQLFAEAAKRRSKNIEEGMLQAAVHLSNGCTVQQAAALMNISHRTVESYMERLRSTYNAKSSLHLIAILIRSKKIL